MAKVERRPLVSDPGPTKLERYRKYLVIDPHDLDDCLIKQPELFDHVADGYVQAVAERDALKLDLEELQAAEDQQLREDAVANEEKITEAMIQQRLKSRPHVQRLHRELLDCQHKVGSWGALKESFQQRNYMLRELVALHLSRLGGTSVGASRSSIADSNRERAGEERSRRRFSSGNG